MATLLNETAVLDFFRSTVGEDLYLRLMDKFVSSTDPYTDALFFLVDLDRKIDNTFWAVAVFSNINQASKFNAHYPNLLMVDYSVGGFDKFSSPKSAETDIKYLITKEGFLDFLQANAVTLDDLEEQIDDFLDYVNYENSYNTIVIQKSERDIVAVEAFADENQAAVYQENIKNSEKFNFALEDIDLFVPDMLKGHKPFDLELHINGTVSYLNPSKQYEYPAFSSPSGYPNVDSTIEGTFFGSSPENAVEKAKLELKGHIHLAIELERRYPGMND